MSIVSLTVLIVIGVASAAISAIKTHQLAYKTGLTRKLPIPNKNTLNNLTKMYSKRRVLIVLSTLLWMTSLLLFWFLIPYMAKEGYHQINRIIWCVGVTFLELVAYKLGEKLHRNYPFDWKKALNTQ